MISVSGRNWEQKKTNKNSVEKLTQDYNFSDIVSQLIISRKFNDTELSYINNDIKLNNVFLKNDDFKKSTKILIETINNKENICILGDYDVDGTTAVAMVYSFLKKYNKNIEYYIPCRYKEGYGISFKSIDYAYENTFSLVIALDCGIRDVEQIDYAKKKKIDFIVCDHHNP